MQVVHDGTTGLAGTLARASVQGAGYVTVGVFDGVHRGHQHLVAAMVETARAAGGTAVAVTFDPHPAAVLGRKPPPLLTTLAERADLLASLGLDVLLVLAFTPDLARTSAGDFVAALVQHLHLAELWGGPDFALGYRREGDIPCLRRLGAQWGFSVHVVEPLMWEGALVNSSRVRAALKAGDLPQATGCLGRPYRLAGTVVHGRGVGRDMGIPTANLAPPPGRLIPAGGIYACYAHGERLSRHPAVVNVGTRPTFDEHTLVVEAHLLDFDGDLYGQTLALDFIARLRDERAFPSVKALVEQIHKDIAQARDILGVGFLARSEPERLS